MNRVETDIFLYYKRGIDMSLVPEIVSFWKNYFFSIVPSVDRWTLYG